MFLTYLLAIVQSEGEVVNKHCYITEMIFLWCKNEQISVNQCESRAALKGIVGMLWSTSQTKGQLTRGGFLNPAANNMKADSRKTLCGQSIVCGGF